MYHVGRCPECEEGLLGIRLCDDISLVLCDECDALWLAPPEDNAPPAMLSADPPCPRCGESLWGEQAHWADRDEIEAAGWRHYVAGEIGDRKESGGTRIAPITDTDDPESTESPT